MHRVGFNQHGRLFSKNMRFESETKLLTERGPMMQSVDIGPLVKRTDFVSLLGAGISTPITLTWTTDGKCLDSKVDSIGGTTFEPSIYRLLFGDFSDQSLHGYNFVSNKEHVLDVELLPGCAGCHDLQVTRTQAEQPMPK